MFRTAILRSAAAATRVVVRPVPQIASRVAIAPVMRTTSFAPKTVVWQGVRCYAAGGSLDKEEVYERIRQLLAAFDKVRWVMALPKKAQCGPGFLHTDYPGVRPGYSGVILSITHLVLQICDRANLSL